MKIILFGSTGMLGNYLNSYLSDKYDVLALSRDDWDLSELNEEHFSVFMHNLSISKDDVIINAAGIIKQRDYKPLDMIMVNSVFPHLLANIKKIYKCNVIHITTDCVFDGDRGLYFESDEHNPIDDYGKSKSLGEASNLTTIRTSIIGEELNNKKSLLEWVKSNKAVDGYTNHIWNGITCLEFSKYIDKMITNNIYWEGVRHIFSPDNITKYELIKMISDIYDLNIIVNPTEYFQHIHRNLETIFTNPITNSIFSQINELKNYNINERNT